MRPYIWFSLIVAPVVSAVLFVVLLLAHADSGYITMVAALGVGWPGGVLVNLLLHRWKDRRVQGVTPFAENEVTDGR
jgi:hypothetical protein